MNKRQKLDFLFILNSIIITYLVYFIFTYIDLVNKNQITKTNINIYIYFLLLNIAMFVKRIIE